MELLGLIEQIQTDDLASEVVVRMAQLQGEILALLGRLDEAEQVLSETLERAKENAEELIQAEILSSMADVSRKQGEMMCHSTDTSRPSSTTSPWTREMGSTYLQQHRLFVATKERASKSPRGLWRS